MSGGTEILEFLPGHAEGVWVVVMAVAVVLALTTLARGIRWMRSPDDELREAMASIASWWVLFGLLVVMVVMGPWAVMVVMALISLLLLRETFRLAGHAAWLPFALLAAGVGFLLVWHGGHGVLTHGIPLSALILLAGEATWRRRASLGDSGADSTDESDGDLGDEAAGDSPGEGSGVVGAWLMGTVGPLYAAGVALLPSDASGDGQGLSWFLLLVVLTALNDSAQAWWGRTVGSHRMTPRLSPHKTWEGLAGGVATTSVAAILLGPLVTPVGRAVPLAGAAPGPAWLWGLFLGVVLSLGGLAGDLLASRLKRRAGVKDSGQMVPGQGGLMDRIDSLTVTAPLLYLAALVFWLG